MTISYAVTVCNEFYEFKNLINQLLKYVDLSLNEIVILCDISKSNDDVLDYGKKLEEKQNIKFITDTFNNHFSEWKNKFKTLCSKDYIFQIDADELPSIFLLQNIETILYSNPSIELFWIPRENYVSGLTDEHIKKWKWRLDQLNRINFPDYQARLFKNLPNIYWKNKVHEIVVGCQAQASLPAEPRFCLIHNKNIIKQELQNNYYETL